VSVPVGVWACVWGVCVCGAGCEAVGCSQEGGASPPRSMAGRLLLLLLLLPPPHPFQPDGRVPEPGQEGALAVARLPAVGVGRHPQSVLDPCSRAAQSRRLAC
jgi:hypothetical protein